MNPIGLYAVGLLGPGLEDFASARAVLAGDAVLTPDAVRAPPPGLLPANERRRTTATIRLALKVAEEATADADRSQLRSVFASSSGDMDIIDRICDALTQPDPVVSPVQFHNSVHNAPAGNWSIATRNPAPATALSGYNASFATGLLEAATLQLAEGGEVLLACYDVPSMDTFIRVRPITHPFAVALRLGPASGAPWRLTLDFAQGAPEDRCLSDDLETLRDSNPAARALPLLEQLVRGHGGHVRLKAPLGRSLGIRIEP
ncbi:beta-ketoacyl synthase chain length factor [Thioalkalivibrio sp. ALJ16]|uniref:beta-ketoacyl synthase chain length factor n=1 Tax=Thioalkalivibrio sp. ALJ16 TaxID=1158762 RepID=UPI00037AFCC1|nr:beta-ketoacyl synthase chain length factor [Thioalkalivibrio sp. ALJ16]